MYKIIKISSYMASKWNKRSHINITPQKKNKKGINTRDDKWKIAFSQLTHTANKRKEGKKHALEKKLNIVV